jgi:Spy/CpxP family protein refolding chaperone
MTHTLKAIAIASASAVAFLGMVAANANADYPGLGGGNPSNVDIWEASHKDFGKVMHGTHHTYEDLTR